MKKSFLNASLAVGCMLVATVQAKADILIFDNYSTNVGQYNSVTNRSADFDPGTFVSGVAANTTISEIGVYTNQVSAGEDKFIIADHATGNILFVSTPTTFAADAGGAFSWKVSDPFSFTLLAGQQYDIGFISDTSANVPYAFPGFNYTQSGITSDSNNPNFSSYANPIESPAGATTIPLQLYAPAAVPEPGSMALAAVGLGALVVVRQVRSRVKKSA
jgi:hypothetical protein